MKGETDMNKERILRLADAIKNAELSKSRKKFGFNMFDVYSEGNLDMTGYDCETVGCLVGWTRLLFGKNVKKSYLASHQADSFTKAKDELGLTEREASLLFLNNRSFSALTITPAQAVEVLREFAETGEVDWSPYLTVDEWSAELAAADSREED